MSASRIWNSACGSGDDGGDSDERGSGGGAGGDGDSDDEWCAVTTWLSPPRIVGGDAGCSSRLVTFVKQRGGGVEGDVTAVKPGQLDSFISFFME